MSLYPASVSSDGKFPYLYICGSNILQCTVQRTLMWKHAGFRPNCILATCQSCYKFYSRFYFSI